MCTCIKQMNEQLREYNTELVATINLFDTSVPERICLETTKVDLKNRLRPKRIVATFCPICGQRYVPEPATEAAQS